MENIINTTILGLFFGTIGTTVGGIIGCTIKNTSNKFLSFILSFAAGLMMSVICFDLIPEALEISNITQTIIGIILGIIAMIFCDVIVDKKFNTRKIDTNIASNLLKTGIIVSIGLAIHNIPEGISMALPMKTGGMKVYKVMLYVILSGIATGIGALIGGIIGRISEQIISLCLSFAAGAMLYIVSGELVPESNKLYHGRMTALGNIFGIVIGIIVTKL